VDGVRLYRDGRPVAELSINDGSYLDTGVRGGTTYSYYATAFQGDVESNTSQTATVTTPECPTPDPGSITVHKINERSAPLPGACFLLYPDAGGGTYEPFTSVAYECDAYRGPNDGTIPFAGIVAGEYVLVENPAPPGYLPAPNAPVTVAAGRNTDITIRDMPETSGLTVRTMTAGSAFVLDACYDLYALDPVTGGRGEKLPGYSCDAWDETSDGITRWSSLATGDYVVAQAGVIPDGYEPAADVYAEVQSGHTSEVTVQNFPAIVPGDTSPVFGGTKLRIVSGSSQNLALDPGLAYDGDFETSWETTSTSAPEFANLTLDLGGARRLTGVRWSYRERGGADEVLINTSIDGTNWSPVGRYGNAPDRDWYGEDLARDGRYVRVTFLNPNRDAVLGYLAEVEIWGIEPVVYPPGTPNPSLPGVKVGIVASSSGAGSVPSRAHDGSTATSWETTSSTAPANASLTLDAGSAKRLTGLKWVYGQTGSADEVLIQSSVDGTSWRTVGRYGNAPAGSWHGVATVRDARFVRFSFLNPNRDAVLGYMAEVQLWAEAPVLPPGDVDPRLSGSKLRVTGSSGASNASSPSRLYDGSTSTSWETTRTTPASATFTLDLGRTYQLSGVKWIFRATGSADNMLVQTSVDGRTWRTVGRYGNAPALKWYGEDTVRDARYVRVSFTNPNRDVALGYVAEVQVWGLASSVRTAAMASSNARQRVSAPKPTATATATAAPTRMPTQTATPPTPTATMAATATATATPMVTMMPTTAATAPAASGSGVISGTGGTGANCRQAASLDAPVLIVLAEGSSIVLTGNAQGDWVPVLCGDQAGYVARQYVTIDGDATAPPGETATPPPSTETVTPVPTATPWPVVAVGDSVDSGAAGVLVDGDAASFLLLESSAPLTEMYMTLDLGQVRPVQSVRWQVAATGSAPVVEVQLSEDGQSWWSFGRQDGTGMAPGNVYEQQTGAWARYVRIVIANPGMQLQLGGIAEVTIWPAEEGQARPLNAVAAFVTPVPQPTLPPSEPTPMVEVERQRENVVPTPTDAAAPTEPPQQAISEQGESDPVPTPTAAD